MLTALAYRLIRLIIRCWFWVEPGVSLRKLKKIYVEITNHCNLTCSFCHQSDRPKAWMLPAEFAEICKQAKVFTNYLYLHVLGEPLLHPDLSSLLAICQEQALAVNVTTNGTLLKKRQALLLDSPAVRQVNISLHSAVEANQGPALFSYLDAVFTFIERANAVSRPLYINLRLWNLFGKGTPVLSSQNEPVLRKIEEFFALPIPLVDALTPGHGIHLSQGVFLSQNSRFIWPHAPSPEHGTTGFCRGLRDHVAILVDGTVVPCCLDAEADIRLGNIHDNSLEEILASSKSIAMYDGLSQRRLVEPLCRRCTFRH